MSTVALFGVVLNRMGKNNRDKGGCGGINNFDCELDHTMRGTKGFWGGQDSMA